MCAVLLDLLTAFIETQYSQSGRRVEYMIVIQRLSGTTVGYLATKLTGTGLPSSPNEARNFAAASLKPWTVRTRVVRRVSTPMTAVIVPFRVCKVMAWLFPAV